MLKALVEAALAEDAPWGDITSDTLLSSDTYFEGSFVARQAGVSSGTDAAAAVFEAIDPDVRLTASFSNGAPFVANDVLATVTGPAASVLRGERVALNLLQHACAVATLTSRYVAAIQGLKAAIIDTRKTTPGLRQIDKQAVRDGGGRNHRFSLSDAVLVKDNHIAALGGFDAMGDLRKRFSHTSHIEIEVDTIGDIEAAIAAGADTVLCDNFSVAELSTAVEVVAGRALVNASGGVDLDNVRSIAETGVDLISVGAITHSAGVLDIGLDAKHS